MRTHFAEVLASERASLAGVTDAAMLAEWRRRVVEELMTPGSPYLLALQRIGDTPDQADFLDQWCELIAGTVDRLFGVTVDAPSPSALPRRADVDAHKTAVLILAALHGGCTLSRIAQDPRPLNAALDLALVPFCCNEAQLPRKNGSA